MKKDYIPIYLTVICYSYTALLAYVLFQYCENGWNAVYAFLLEWQTLAGTILASFLAGCVSFILYKITKYREEEQRKRNFIAERAMLPHALAEVGDYCDEVAFIRAELYIMYNGKPDISQKIPELPLEAFVIFQNCIRHSHQEQVSTNALVSIIEDIQMIDARLNGFNYVYHSKESCIQELTFVCGTKAKTENLFRFSRGLEDTVKPIKVQVLQLLEEQLRWQNDSFVASISKIPGVIEHYNDEPPFEYDPKTGKDSNRLNHPQ